MRDPPGSPTISKDIASREQGIPEGKEFLQSLKQLWTWKENP